MHPFPHRYVVAAQAGTRGDVSLQSDGVPPLATETPEEFDGPGDRWSPETLLVGAVADCFVLTFRGIAAKSRLSWTSIACSVDGLLDRVDNVTRFTRFDLHVRLGVPEGTDVQLARRVMDRAESTCLIARSLNAESHLDARVDVAPAPAVAVGVS